MAPKTRSCKLKHYLKAKQGLASILNTEIINKTDGTIIIVAKAGYKKLMSNAALQKSINNGFSMQQHFSAVASFKSLFESAKLQSIQDDRKGDDNVKILRYISAFTYQGKNIKALLTIKHTLNIDIKRGYALELMGYLQG